MHPTTANDSLIDMVYNALSLEQLEVMVSRKKAEVEVRQKRIKPVELSEEQLYKRELRTSLLNSGRLFKPKNPPI